jgi:predicted AlkP superfamily pyrophosphatase or phosphodiesterase
MSVKRFVTLILLFLIAAPLAAADKPRLALVIVVDQMRADYLDRFKADGPLRKRLDRGTVFTSALHDYVPSETAPGHATISTGRPPGVHGIISNDIYDRKTGTVVPIYGDVRRGIAPVRLKARALADAVRAANPASKVVSVSLKERGVVFLAGQKPTAAVWYDGNQRLFVTAPYYGSAPPWVEPVNRELPSFSQNVPPPFVENDFRYSPAGDRAVLELSTRAIAGERLGADDACDLLTVSFSATDFIGHRWGPDSEQMRRQLEALDGTISELLDAASKASGGRMIAVITADHGVSPVPESPQGREVGERRVNTSDFTAELEAAFQRAHPAKGRKWIVGVEMPDIYLNRALAKERHVSWSSLVKDGVAALAGAPDVAAAYIPGKWPSDDWGRKYRRSYVEGLSGDVQIRVAPNVLIIPWPTGSSHGSPYDTDALVFAAFLGTGGHPGRVARRISVESLAPTMAAALGVSLPAGDGPVLPEALPAPSPR